MWMHKAICNSESLLLYSETVGKSLGVNGKGWERDSSGKETQVKMNLFLNLVRDESFVQYILELDKG